MIYCDFCGKQLSNNVKYCRHCGRMLAGRLEDTMPLPAINEALLYNYKRQTVSLPWTYLPTVRKFSLDRLRTGRKVYELASVAVVAALAYILATFNSVQEYQILTASAGVVLAACSWYKSKRRQ